MRDSNDASLPRTGRPSRSFLPRFGLRSLFVFALLFCLTFGWLGRNFVRIREEDAAIEALRQAGARIYIQTEEGWDYHPATPYFYQDSGRELLPSFASRLIGWSSDASVIRIEILSDDADEARLRRAVASLGLFPEVESLGLAGPLVDDASLQALSSLPRLESLALARTSVTAEGLARIPSPERFRILRLSGQEFPSDAPKGVGALQQLAWLSVVRSSLTNMELSTIASLPKLKTLSLENVTTWTAADYALLANAERLRNLSLLGCDLGEDAVDWLAEMTQLDSLAVDGIGDEELAQLASLSRLRWLELRPPVTEEAVLAFAAAHPDCLVKYAPSGGTARFVRGADKVDPDVAEDFHAALTGVPDDVP